MARAQWIGDEGAVYHARARGNDRRPIFRDDADRERFIRAFAESVERFEVRLYLFCLMTNISQRLRKLACAVESNRLLRRQVTAIADDLKHRRHKRKH